MNPQTEQLVLYLLHTHKHSSLGLGLLSIQALIGVLVFLILSSCFKLSITSLPALRAFEILSWLLSRDLVVLFHLLQLNSVVLNS